MIFTPCLRVLLLSFFPLVDMLVPQKFERSRKYATIKRSTTDTCAYLNVDVVTPMNLAHLRDVCV